MGEVSTCAAEDKEVEVMVVAAIISVVAEEDVVEVTMVITLINLSAGTDH